MYAWLEYKIKFEKMDGWQFTFVENTIEILLISRILMQAISSTVLVRHKVMKSG